MHLSSLGPANFFFFSTSPTLSSSAIIMEGGGTGWISGIVILWEPSLTFGRPEITDGCHILFIDVTGDVPFYTTLKRFVDYSENDE